MVRKFGGQPNVNFWSKYKTVEITNLESAMPAKVKKTFRGNFYLVVYQLRKICGNKE